MNTDFKRLLGDATRLTREGDLAAATRTIREALGAGGARRPPPPEPGSPERGPFRQESPTRESPGRGPSSERGSPKPDSSGQGAEGVSREPGAGDEASIIDGEWHTVDARGETAAPAEDAPAGGARAPDGRGTLTRGLHTGRSRALDYRLFVPPLAPDTPPPALVVMLHGCTQDADDFARGTAMDALALEHGFLVLYPEQSSRANAQRCWNWFKGNHQRRSQGEPALIEGAIGEVVAAHGVDAERIFVAGLSAGGAMAAILGDVAPTLFRAIGVHSGLAAGTANDLPGALASMRGGQGRGAPASALDAATRLPPTIVFHGDADRTVHPENGERVVAACVEAARRVSGAVAVAERRQGRDGGRAWTRDVHRDASGDVVVEHWCVAGAAHAWSGGDPRGSYADAAGPDASAEMVRFFLEVAGQ